MFLAWIEENCSFLKRVGGIGWNTFGSYVSCTQWVLWTAWGNEQLKISLFRYKAEHGHKHKAQQALDTVPAEPASTETVQPVAAVKQEPSEPQESLFSDPEDASKKPKEKEHKEKKEKEHKEKKEKEHKEKKEKQHHKEKKKDKEQKEKEHKSSKAAGKVDSALLKAALKAKNLAKTSIKSEPGMTVDAMLAPSVKKEPLTPKQDLKKTASASDLTGFQPKNKRKKESTDISASTAEPEAKKAAKTKTPMAIVGHISDSAVPNAAASEGDDPSSSVPHGQNSSQPASSPAAEPNMAVTDKDVTHKLGPRVGPGGDPNQQEKAKDLYMKADIVIPAIALKKAKQAMSQTPAEAPHYVGILGKSECTCYRVKKPYVEKMILGNLEKYGDQFWSKASSHLKKTSIGVVVLPFNTSFNLQDATCLTIYSLNSFSATCCGCYVSISSFLTMYDWIYSLHFDVVLFWFPFQNKKNNPKSTNIGPS